MSTGVMRAFDCALRYAKTERRGGAAPIVEHQAVGYALADAKASLESARLSVGVLVGGRRSGREGGRACPMARTN
ncbi:hypothetical protein ASD12_25850 [Mesorhizobium sp. Root102]|nr:hypothetical protein ASD12_25850 [Mesorhizobium sp. Root102]